jgi:TetR/AcrR family transcriptional regulator, transcriptional repressor for nem operon
VNTRETIIQLANSFIRDKGYNAFSFHHLSKEIGIKTASIHYHFPTKSDLAIAILEDEGYKLRGLRERLKDKDPLQKLNGFFSIYDKIESENKVCLVGSLATDLHTVEESVQQALKYFASQVLEWVTEILSEGKNKGIFTYEESPGTRALMVATNMLAIVQLCRLTSHHDFKTVKDTIIKDLTK